MKTKVDIITGFLDSGKSTLINSILETGDIAGERLAILQSEIGEIELDAVIINEDRILLKTVDQDQSIDNKLITDIIENYNPDRIIIELNGMSRIDSLLIELESGSLAKKCVINKVINTIDVSTFEVYMANMASILSEQISNSDLIILNKSGCISDEKISIKYSIKLINKSAQIVTENSKDDTDGKQDDKRSKRINSVFILILLAVISSFLIKEVFKPQRRRVNWGAYLFFVIPLIMAYTLPARPLDSSAMSYDIKAGSVTPGITLSYLT